MTEHEFAQKILDLGGHAYVVGGWVRDRLRHATPHDKDYVVAGVAEDVFRAAFPRAFRIGRAFPVFRLRLDDAFCDVAFARSETKTGPGHKGFATSFSPSTTIEEDLRRRDTTINSIALDLATEKRIDPFGGSRDIADKIIRATSAHFTDDPVRALRAARQAAQFGYVIEARTLEMMACCRDEIRLEPSERLLGELRLALLSERPSVFFRYLLDAGLLDVTFPEVHALRGVEQPPEHHPEGDAFEHTLNVLDNVAQTNGRVEVRFAALCHDLGKALTPLEERPHHYRHDKRGLRALEAWSRVMPLPRRWLLCAQFAAQEHMRAGTLVKPGKIVDLLQRLRHHPLGASGFAAIIQADSHSLPRFLAQSETYYAAMDAVRGAMIPENLHGQARGQWLRQRWAAEIAQLEAQ